MITVLYRILGEGITYQILHALLVAIFHGVQQDRQRAILSKAQANRDLGGVFSLVDFTFQEEGACRDALGWESAIADLTTPTCIVFRCVVKNLSRGQLSH